ncbi:CHAD domain-containing protein [Pseudomonas sp. Marseille-QA0892]
MSFRIRAGKKAAREVVRVADKRLAKAAQSLRTDTPKGVHDARKRLKETRALLRLVRQPLGQSFSDWNTDLRDLGRQLSAQRDAAAMVEAWDRLAEVDRRRFSSPAMKRIRERLVQRVEAAPEAEESRAQTAEALEVMRVRLRDWSLKRSGFKLFAAGVEKSYRDGRKALKAVCKAPDHDEVRHDWRKRVKDHWYQVRLLRDAWPAQFDAWEASLDELAEYLGEDHDLFVLRTLIDEQPALFGAPNTRQAIGETIAQRQREIYVDAVRLGHRLYADRPEALVERWSRYWSIAQEQARQDKAERHDENSV